MSASTSAGCPACPGWLRCLTCLQVEERLLTAAHVRYHQNELADRLGAECWRVELDVVGEALLATQDLLAEDQFFSLSGLLFFSHPACAVGTLHFQLPFHPDRCTLVNNAVASIRRRTLQQQGR